MLCRAVLNLILRMKFNHCISCFSGSITFDEHLKGVQSVLRSWGSDQAICDAGLFHSIYGTEGFQGYKLPFSNRAEIRKVRYTYSWCLVGLLFPLPDHAPVQIFFACLPTTCIFRFFVLLYISKFPFTVPIASWQLRGCTIFPPWQITLTDLPFFPPACISTGSKGHAARPRVNLWLS